MLLRDPVSHLNAETLASIWRLGQGVSTKFQGIASSVPGSAGKTSAPGAMQVPRTSSYGSALRRTLPTVPPSTVGQLTSSSSGAEHLPGRGRSGEGGKRRRTPCSFTRSGFIPPFWRVKISAEGSGNETGPGWRSWVFLAVNESTHRLGWPRRSAEPQGGRDPRPDRGALIGRPLPRKHGPRHLG